ncbi:MAG: hypothetical protein KAS32_07045 [Candidatus Peribacteraceae bacterium]|nr:hypothetical protein [Candidatus Peribacteraceae bacterium]
MFKTLFGLPGKFINEIYKMFAKADNNKLSDKKVIMFLVLAVIMIVFAVSYIKVAVASAAFVDVPQGWVNLIIFSVLAFLAPDALIKIFSNAKFNLQGVNIENGENKGTQERL